MNGGESVASVETRIAVKVTDMLGEEVLEVVIA